MTMREDWAELECNGATIDAWTSYSASSDLFTPADACRLSIGVGSSSGRDLKANIAKLRTLMKPGSEVKLWISSGGKRALQGAFVIDGSEVSNDGDGGTQLSVDLRDRAAYLVDCAADPKLYHTNDSLVAVARRAVEPWKIEVAADHVAARDLRQARVTQDKLARLQKKARSWGIPPRLMSEKIAASIDKGTITWDDFVAAQAGGFYRNTGFNVTAGAVEAAANGKTGGAREVTIDERRPFMPGGVPTRLYRGQLTGVPYSGATGLSSLQIYQLRVQDTRPQDGETIWEFLDRHARRNGLLMSMSPDGKLVFCGLHYDQEPSYRIIRRIDGDRTQNNVIQGSCRLDVSNVYSGVIVYGRAKGKNKSRSPFKGEANSLPTDDAYLPYPKLLVVKDNSIKSKNDAQHRAEYELAKSKQSALVLEYTMQGHSQDGLIFAPDTVAQVEDEVTGISGAYYVTARTFTRSSKQGPLTSLKLVKKGAIVLSKQGELA